MLLIAWLFSSSSWPEARQALVAAGIGGLVYVGYARQRRSQAAARANLT
jgi:hypothetical protein